MPLFSNIFLFMLYLRAKAHHKYTPFFFFCQDFMQKFYHS
nr:MAG TPA: Pre-mRNA-splicing factor [Bacteriophage sp.]